MTLNSIMSKALLVLSLASALSFATKVAANQSKVEVEIASFLEAMNHKTLEFENDGDWADIEWVKKKLAHMVEIDQFMRNESMAAHEKGLDAQEAEEYRKRFQPIYKKVDETHTLEMKRIIDIHGWPVISKFGKEAEGHAWLLVQHADHDIDFQKSVLERLEKLLPNNETNPSSYAYLYDRVASSYNDPSKRTLQKYGTQGTCTEKGTWEPLPMIEPEKLDERRASVGLSSMAEYLKLVSKFCSIK